MNTHGHAGTPQHMEWLRSQMSTPEYREHRKAELAAITNDLPLDDLRTLRAIINGKIGKRHITPEQQTAMQAARKKKNPAPSK